MMRLVGMILALALAAQAQQIEGTWLGVLGNSSASFTTATETTGTGIWRGGDGAHAIACDPINANGYCFVTLGYNEIQPPVMRFVQGDPQHPKAIVGDCFLTRFDLVATDGISLYLADTARPDDDTPQRPTSTPWVFVQRYDLNGLPLGFTQSTTNLRKTTANNVPCDNPNYNGIIDYTLTAQANVAQFRPTGIAVQPNGNLLAVAHGGLNQVLLYDKITGVSLGALSVPSPGALTFDSNGDLWSTSGISILNLTNPAGTSVIGFSSPIALTFGNGRLAVADGGTSQQIKSYDLSGRLISTLGQLGGYTGTTAVSPDRFWFVSSLFVSGREFPVIQRSSLAVQADGSLWVVDGGDLRSQHFASDGTFIDTIAWVPDNQFVAVDHGDLSRVFAFGFLEYQWTPGPTLNPGDGKLIRNWAPSMPGGLGYGQFDRIVFVRECPDYGPMGFLLGNRNSVANENLVPMRLPADGTPGTLLAAPARQPSRGPWISGVTDSCDLLADDHSKTIYRLPYTAPATWGAPQVIATLPAGQTPAFVLGKQSYVTDGQQVYFFDGSNGSTNVNGVPIDNGFHFGALTTTAWAWQQSPVKKMLNVWDDLGSYPEQQSFGGLSGNNAFLLPALGLVGWNYNGQYGNGGSGPGTNQGISNGYKLFTTGGAYVGDFGVSQEPDHNNYAEAGYSGNYFNTDCAASIEATQPVGYCFSGDESVHHGIHVWRIAQTIPPDFTLSTPATLALPSSTTLTFNVSLTAQGGFDLSQVQIRVLGLPGGVSYGVNGTAITLTGGLLPNTTTPITVQAQGGGITHNSTIQLTTVAPPDFTIGLLQPSLTLTPNTQFQDSIVMTGLNGFDVTSLQYQLSSLPSGVQASIANGMLTLTTGTLQASSTGAITITASGSGITHSVTLSVNVPTPAFTVTGITPATVSVGIATNLSISGTGFDRTAACSAPAHCSYNKPTRLLGGVTASAPGPLTITIQQDGFAVPVQIMAQ